MKMKPGGRWHFCVSANFPTAFNHLLSQQMWHQPLMHLWILSTKLLVDSATLAVMWWVSVVNTIVQNHASFAKRDSYRMRLQLTAFQSISMYIQGMNLISLSYCSLVKTKINQPLHIYKTLMLLFLGHFSHEKKLTYSFPKTATYESNHSCDVWSTFKNQKTLLSWWMVCREREVCVSHICVLAADSR